MAAEYRQMLLDKKAHDEIKAAKAIVGSLTGVKLSAREVIDEFLGRRLRFLTLQNGIRAYINAFVAEASSEKSVLGILLFGSVARNSFNSYSDIDILVVIDGDALGYFERISGIVESVEGLRKPIVDAGMHLRIRPLLLSSGDLDSFRPIYIGFLEDGIVLFERNDTLFNFLNSIRKSVSYEKKVVNGAAMVEWRIRA